MRHTNITLTLEGLSAQPQAYVLERGFAREVRDYIESRLDERIPANEVLKDLDDPLQGPAAALRGMRLREELTQKKLAETLGIRQHHVSEMENGKRSISKEMAKQLGAALRTNYRVFL